MAVFLPCAPKNIAGRRNHDARPVLRHSDTPEQPSTVAGTVSHLLGAPRNPTNAVPINDFPQQRCESECSRKSRCVPGGDRVRRARTERQHEVGVTQGIPHSVSLGALMNSFRQDVLAFPRLRAFLRDTTPARPHPPCPLSGRSETGQDSGAAVTTITARLPQDLFICIPAAGASSPAARL